MEVNDKLHVTGVVQSDSIDDAALVVAYPRSRQTKYVEGR